MARYDYSGPAQMISLATGQKKVRVKGANGPEEIMASVFEDFSLIEGQECDLPEGNPAVQSMVAAKLLTPVAPASKTAKAKPAGATSKGDETDG
ncbi:hypothetical protein ACUXV3_12290 [Roseobacteraceae bacterium NS-SX3]